MPQTYSRTHTNYRASKKPWTTFFIFIYVVTNSKQFIKLNCKCWSITFRGNEHGSPRVAAGVRWSIDFVNFRFFFVYVEQMMWLAFCCVTFFWWCIMCFRFYNVHVLNVLLFFLFIIVHVSFFNIDLLDIFWTFFFHCLCFCNCLNVIWAFSILFNCIFIRPFFN